MKRNTIRLICILLALVMVAGILPRAAWAATEGFTVKLMTPEKRNFALGETIRIPVVIGNGTANTRYNSFDLRFAYDPTVLKLSSSQISGMYHSEKDGTIRVLRFGSDLKVDTTVFTLTFEAIRPGTANIAAVDAHVGTRASAMTKDASDAVILNHAEVVILSAAGDVDGDGFLTENDPQYLIWHTLFPKMYPLSDAKADYNSDGDITDADAVLLLWYILFPDKYPIH